VGGLGCSPYLQEYLKTKYKRKNIDVLQTDGMKPYVSPHYNIYVLLTYASPVEQQFVEEQSTKA
jgi:hypothetical protein